MLKSKPRSLLLATIVLSAILAFQAVGWLLAWKSVQIGAKVEAHFALLKSDQHLLKATFHKDFVQKRKIGKKEIILDGQLFDFKITSETGDSLHLALYHDQKEQALLSLLGHVFKSSEHGTSPTSMPLAAWLAKWLSAAFLLPEKPVLSSGIARVNTRQSFPPIHLQAQSAPSVFAPPPEV